MDQKKVFQKNKAFKFFTTGALIALLTCSSIVKRNMTVGVVPNKDFPKASVGKVISPQMGTKHQNQPFLFNGYAILSGNAEFEIYDISDPTKPVLKKTFASKHKSGEAESHQMSMHKTWDGEYFLATLSGKGIDIWNMTDVLNPVYVKDIVLPGVNYGDVDNGVWGVSWQGNYIYVGSTNRGIQVLDVSNMSDPQIVANVSTSQLSNFKAGPLFALGNVLLVASPKGSGGVATIDITNPKKPVVMSAKKEANSYIGGFYGKYAMLINPVRFYDISNPNSIKALPSISAEKSEYVAFDDGKLFLGGLRGGTHGVHIYDLSNLPSMKKVIHVKGRDTRWDDQFVCPIGNLLIMADDQKVDGKYVGAVIACHRETKDVVGPKVELHFPKNNETKVDVNSSVGISFSDWIEFASVNKNNFEVRPVGGSPIKGSFSWLYTTLNFQPETPLQANTVYEVVLKTDGIRDLVGNPLANDFKFTFSTGASVIVDVIQSPIISGNAPVKLADKVTWTIQNPSNLATYKWTLDGNEIGTGTSISPIFTEIGRYQACVQVFRKDNSNPSNNVTFKEAETAVLAGGVTVQNNQAGFSGSGFADFPTTQGSNVYLEWDVDGISGEKVNLDIVYAATSDRPMNLYVNDVKASGLNLVSTGAWTTYKTVSVSNITLKAGVNKLRIVADAGSQGCNIDKMGVVRTTNGGILIENKCFLQVVYNTTSVQPNSSSTIIKKDNFLWNVNPDAGTVSKVNLGTNLKEKETKVGIFPSSVAAVKEEIWVTNRDSYSISRLNSNGDVLSTIKLPYASEPTALISAPNGNFVYVSLRATSEVLKLNATTGQVIDKVSLAIGNDRPQLGALAVNGVETKLYVSRFISKGIEGGEIYELNPSTMDLVKTINLKSTVTEDSSNDSRGIPNYINSISINPSGTEMWAASKKDNIERGSFRDGKALNHMNTVRAITSRINLSNSTEKLVDRIDIDNSDRCNSVTFNDRGDIAFVTMAGNELVNVIDTANGYKLSEFSVGKVPDGAVYIEGKLYVHNFLSRSISVVDVSKLVDGSGESNKIKDISVVANETLAANILKGKQLFYDASSVKLNAEGYMSCASCHHDGSHDGQTWDFTSLDEGLRNTIDLRGRSGSGHGRLHWTANFNEIHDFENQIRILGGGDGLMTDADFESTKDPFGLNKAGKSIDLDALNDYITSLSKVPASPYKNEDGTLTSSAKLGKTIFARESCMTCHSTNKFTDSPTGALHDIGSWKTSSGMRIGATITGFDTPTLKGIWNTAPYLHDGSAKTLKEAVIAHSKVKMSITDSEMDDLVSYMNQIDEEENNVLGILSFNYLNNLNVYPNPSSGLFNLPNDLIWEVYDIKGSLVKYGSGRRVDLSSIKTGIYILKTPDGTQKLVKN